MKFKERVLHYLIERVIAALLESLEPHEIKEQLDKLIDHVENMIAQSENKFDDKLIPIIKVVRDLFAIPDLPDQIT